MLKFFIWYPVCIQPTLILPYTLSLLLLFSPKSCPTLCDPMDYSTPGLPVLLTVCSDSCPLSQWCYLTVPSSASPFSSYSQSFLASESFPMSWLFASCGQKASASASVLPMNIQAWFPLGLTGWISMQPKGLSRVFSNITVQKLQFFSIQPSLWSNSCIHTWLLGKPYLWFYWPLLAKWCVCFLIHYLSLSYFSFQGTSIF